MAQRNRILKTLMVSLFATTALSGIATAQSGLELERLLGAAQPTQALRAIDTNVRASKRYAIVIGNSDYEAIPDLPNANSDALKMADFFRSQGYEVNYHEDITKRSFEDTLRRVLFDVDKDTEVVLFFAGHGFQIGSENYLVPVDADLNSIYDVPFEAVSLGSLVGIIGARARLQVVILDSCRDNPFAGKKVLTQLGNELREARTGFSSQAAPLNSMMIFSTSPGSVAFDGDGENSPFTSALLQQASAEPNALIKDVFEGVRRLVYQRTNGRQIPWDSSTLVEPVSFGLGDASKRPLYSTVSGGGAKRGLARIMDVASSSLSSEAAASDVDHVIEAEFLPEVAIGTALHDSLRPANSDKIIITQQPEKGLLMLPDANGFQRSVLNEEISGDDLRNLVLVNNSVQVPAVSLENGLLQDHLALNMNGDAQQVRLYLRPDPCDFHAGDHLDPDGMGLTRYANEIRPYEALDACEASVARDPKNGRYVYQLGRVQIALREYDAARANLRKARDLGHTRAWQALGNSILNKSKEAGGRGNPKADKEVLKLFAKGVEAGDPYAFYSLGRQFMRFGEESAIEVEGYDLMMRALEVGHTFAMNELGYFYLNEDGEFYDPERGLRYLRESASREDIYGFNNMGLVYLNGLGGVPKDFAMAYDYFRQAARGGHPKAPYNLGRMYRAGLIGGGENKSEALRWFTVGLERGDALSGGNGAHLIATKGVDGNDLYDAAILGAKAAALSNQKSSGKARALIEQFPDDVLIGGAQQIINDLGGDVTVTGVFDDTTKRELAKLTARLGENAAPKGALERIIYLSSLVWKTSPFRVDLY